MSNQLDVTIDPTQTGSDQTLTYQIRVHGHLGQQWTEWFEGLTITLEENGDTLFTGAIADQAALYGLLRKVRDVGMTLLSINRLKPGELVSTDVTEY
jgi:hypothetical protein